MPPTDDRDEDISEQIISILSENAPVIGAVSALIALAPPILPMFPPQGLPQPGGIGASGEAPGGGGGGILPTAALSVGILL